MNRLFAPTCGMRVEIAFPKNSEKTTISVSEPHSGSGKYVPTVEINMSKKIQIREIMDARNDKIKEFYYRIWFGDNAEVLFDTSINSKVGPLLPMKQSMTLSTPWATLARHLWTVQARKSLHPWILQLLLAGKQSRSQFSRV